MNTLKLATIGLVIGTGVLTTVALAAESKVPASDARITMSEARTTALKAHPGRITDAELERENGGSGLRYSFDIRENGRTYEVGVDAKTGSVLENKTEGANPD